MMRIVLIAAISTALAATLPASEAAETGFVCPYAKAADAPKGAPTLTAEFFSGASDLTADKRLPILVNDLRNAGMSPAGIVDHLVGAYCPLVAANSGLTDGQKTQMVRRFARQVAGMAYVPSQQDETAILVDVPMPPDLFDQVNQAATKAGLSRDAWVDGAVRRALAAQ